ncbi:MAG TPA: right-handed parallel beta-helix repeat-containing protein, partial [Pyrinomonadaceae bacterium]
PGNSRAPRSTLLARLAARLSDEMAMEESAAHWAIRTWALALGVITHEQLEALEQSDEPPTGQNAAAPPQVASQAHSPRAPRTHAEASQPPAAAGTIPSTSQTARRSFVVALDGSGDFLTLTDAIRRAPPGSLLLVRPGIYNEGFVIDKTLEIAGDGAVEEIIVRATTSSCLVMQADSATVRNLTLRGQARSGGPHDSGFFAVDITHGRLLLEACDISSDSLACVAIHNTNAAPLIRACHIHHGVDSGVFAFDGAQGLIESCDIAQNSNVGIAVTTGASTGVRDCRIHHGADAGIVVWNRAANVIEGCDIFANRSTNVGISDGGTATLRRCRIHDGENTGVLTHRAGRAEMEECNLYRHAEPALAVTGGGEARLRDCQIHEGQSDGVFVQDAGRARLESCDVFRNRASGLHVDANGLLIARECRINDNGHVGVSCEAGGTAEIEGCDLTGNRVAAWESDHGSQVVNRNNRF